MWDKVKGKAKIRTKSQFKYDIAASTRKTLPFTWHD